MPTNKVTLHNTIECLKLVKIACEIKMLNTSKIYVIEILLTLASYEHIKMNKVNYGSFHLISSSTHSCSSGWQVNQY